MGQELTIGRRQLGGLLALGALALAGGAQAAGGPAANFARVRA